MTINVTFHMYLLCFLMSSYYHCLIFLVVNDTINTHIAKLVGIPASSIVAFKRLFISCKKDMNMNNSGNTSKPAVVVTGFGPFACYAQNASWEAVGLMNAERIEKKHDVELVRREIPVSYEKVDKLVPELWKQFSPMLMIHVGVSHYDKMTIESQAHRTVYQIVDVCGKCPENNTCPAEGATRIATKLDTEKICNDLNNDNSCNIGATLSNNAGGYLCEYIYYTSLSVDNTRTLFIHVPDTVMYSAEQIARALEKILDLCLEQVKCSQLQN